MRSQLAGNGALAREFSPDGFSGLGLAAFFGHVNVAKELLKAGADPNSASRNRMKVTPLHSAVANRDSNRAYQLADLLLEHGADANVAQESGWTPLQQAAAHGYSELVKRLLAAGADKAAKGADGRTAFDLAQAGQHSATAQLLRG